MRLRNTPLLHFLAGGALLFCLTRAGASIQVVSPPAEPVVITAADVAQMRTAYTTETGLAPTPADEAALVDDAIDEELLFREAVARGLDRNDRSVRTWLVEQMRVLTDHADVSVDEDDLYARALDLGLDRHDLVVRRILVHKIRLLASRVDGSDATDAELRAHHERHADAYRLRERISLWHVFLSREKHGDDVAAHAGRLLAKLREQRTAPRDAVREGDSFALPSHLVAQAQPQLEKVFGADFAAQVLARPERAWSGPIGSPYGVHLVWVERREPSTVARFEDVRGRVLEAWREERSAQRLATLLRELRARYPLAIESAAWSERGNG